MRPWSKRRHDTRGDASRRCSNTGLVGFIPENHRPPTAEPSATNVRGHGRRWARHRARARATWRALGRHAKAPWLVVRRPLVRIARRLGARLRRLLPHTPGEKAEFRKFTYIGWGGIVPGIIGTAAALATKSPMLGLVVTNVLYLVNAPANGLFGTSLARRLDKGELGTTTDMGRDATLADHDRQLGEHGQQLGEHHQQLGELRHDLDVLRASNSVTPASVPRRPAERDRPGRDRDERRPDARHRSPPSRYEER